jgi:outer membrane lipoprotein SlyB
MHSLTFGKSLQALLAIATAIVGLASAEQTVAQPYYYQPAPDYYHNDTVSGTFLGGAMGAITGALIGGKHHAGQDALIGAGVGAVTGNLVGQAKDRNDVQRAAAGQAAVNQMNAQAVAMAVTDNDLVQMTRAGISEDVIISTMRSRGTRIDLSPQSLIALRQQGVSDRVVMSAQQMGGGSGYAPGPPGVGPTVVSEIPPPPAVIVEPAYRPYPYYYYPRPYPYYYGHYYHPHTVVRVGF